MSSRSAAAPVASRPWQRVVVGLITCYAGFGLYAVVFALGEGSALRPVPLALVVVASASCVWTWRSGPGRLAPVLVSGVVCALGAVDAFGLLDVVRGVLAVMALYALLGLGRAWVRWGEAQR